MLTEINDFINRVSGLRVLVIGETIQDEFIPVTYEGHSMKSNCPVIRLEGKRNIQEGGAAAVANHLRDFVTKVDLITNPAGTIVKTRYVDTDDKRKHIEINKFAHQDFGKIDFSARDYDLVIVADFGHGFCDSLKDSGNFCFMAQTNSNNFGFNRLSKWKTWNKRMICMDLREASLQMNQRIKVMDDQKLMELFHYELNSQLLFVTLGGKGSVFTNGKQIWHQPVFKSQIVDTIGAGDTFYAFASLIADFKDADKFQFIPGLAASLSTTWLCNEKSVTKENLLKHAAQYI
jgi:bifunctional ADP-heptose synthase (sugar kinase/adenylyltransferase)